jgi:hypothetical protein
MVPLLLMGLGAPSAPAVPPVGTGGYAVRRNRERHYAELERALRAAARKVEPERVKEVAPAITTDLTITGDPAIIRMQLAFIQQAQAAELARREAEDEEEAAIILLLM